MSRPRFLCSRRTCGRPVAFRELDFELSWPHAGHCPDCGAPTIDTWAPWIAWLEVAAFVLSALVVGIILAIFLEGCAGAPFTAGEALELEQGGAAGAITSTNQGGAAIASAGGGQNVPDTSGSSGIGDAGAGGGVATACELAGTATAFASWTSGDGGPPSSAIDGSSSTRWASGVPQAAGQWFEVALAAPLELERLVLVSRASDVPLAVALGHDGVAVPVTSSSAPGQFTLDFAPHRTTTTIRLELEQASSSWWSIDELEPGCP